ncbi:MAG: hypothetical protein P4L53_09370 [Candidatus Obscuribacterales bacterium]|nr:hypothetical protein [Candidatus Obscuribacterales bacterium]
MNTNKNLKARSAVAAMEDRRRAQDVLMEVDKYLQVALTACRAIAYDVRAIDNVELRKSARRLLRLVQTMKDGPNFAVWAELSFIENAAQKEYQRAQEKLKS